ncbi:hypothetical protein [Nisaea sp.]|uniref:hypothetical protein n=1 Tax=Nisaea sp. TaxID=2024842 RepID=UPI0032657800
MTVENQGTNKSDRVAFSALNAKERLVALPDNGDATEWCKYSADETRTLTNLTRFLFRRDVRRACGTTGAQEYDLQPGTIIKRSGPFEHCVISSSEEPAIFRNG